MAIKQKIIRKLLAASGGYCGKPDCHKSLFLFFERGEITNIEELAHIIGQKKRGPRGKSEMPLTDRDEFDNIILLCPTCHTIIDKNPLLFPGDIIREWKRDHENSIKGLFAKKKFVDRTSARSFLAPLLAENRSIFTNYGPFSKSALMRQTEAEKMWRKLCLQKLIPNNRTIEEAVANNLDLLTDEEIEMFYVFKLHREGFEYNKLSGDVNGAVQRFPVGFENIFK